MRGPGLVAFAAILIGQCLAAASAAEPEGSRDDLLAVLGAALYPVAVMAYCHREVAAEPAFVAAGSQWNQRNWSLLANLEERATAAGVTEEARREADVATLAAIEAVVASQADGAAYCRLVANVSEGGYYDIDRRADLAPALKRIFGAE